MSLIIFFGIALIIFLSGVLVLSITFYHWFKQYKLAKAQKLEVTPVVTTLQENL